MVLFTCQSGDLTVAKECATKCVHLAAPIAKSPSTFEEIVAGLGYETNYKTQVRDGQVYDQHVGWCPQRFKVLKRFQYY